MSDSSSTYISLSFPSDSEPSHVFMPRRANRRDETRSPSSSNDASSPTPPAELLQHAQVLSPDVSLHSNTQHSSASSSDGQQQAADEPLSVHPVDVALTDSLPEVRARPKSLLELDLLSVQRALNIARPSYCPLVVLQGQEGGLFGSRPLNQAFVDHRSPSEWSAENKRDNAPPQHRLDYYRRYMHHLQRKLAIVSNGGQPQGCGEETAAEIAAASARRVREWKVSDEAVWEQAEFNLQCFDENGNNSIAARRREIRAGPWTPIQMLEEYEIVKEEEEEERQGLLLREVVVRDIAPLIRVSHVMIGHTRLEYIFTSNCLNSGFHMPASRCRSCPPAEDASGNTALRS